MGGAPGYYLSYANQPVTGLPAALFAKCGQATLWVLILLQSQTASPWEPTVSPPQTVADAIQWSLAFTWQHRDAAQDQTSFGITLGSATPGSIDNTLAAPASPIFQALAQFDWVWGELQQTLALLTAPPAVVAANEPILVAAIGTFAALVAAVANLMSFGEWPASPASAPPSGAIEYGYTAQTIYLEGPSGPARGQLLLTPQGPPDPPLAPVIFLPPAERPLDAFATADGQLVYSYPPGTPAFTPLLHRCVFGGNSVLAAPNGASLISVTRNASLLPESATSPLLIYETAAASYNYWTVPFIQQSAVIPIGSGSAAGVGSALATALTTIFGSGDPLPQPYQLTLVAEYGVQINADLGLFALIPAIFVPQTEMGESYTISTFTAALASQMTAWATANGVRNTAPDAYQLSLTVGLAADGPPLLQLTQLQYLLT